MAKFAIVYQSCEPIYAREIRTGEWIQYDAIITIKDGGKNPVTIEMTFDSIPPFALELPKTHKINAENLTRAYLKVIRFFDRHGFVFK